MYNYTIINYLYVNYNIIITNISDYKLIILLYYIILIFVNNFQNIKNINLHK